MKLHWLSHPHGHECHVLKAKAPLGLGLTRAVYRPLALSPLGLPTGGLSLAKKLYDKINLLSVKIDVGVLNAEKGQKFHNRKKFIAMTSIFFIWIIRAKSFKSYKLPYPYEEGTGMRPNLLPTRDKIPLPRGEFLPIVYSNGNHPKIIHFLSLQRKMLDISIRFAYNHYCTNLYAPMQVCTSLYKSVEVYAFFSTLWFFLH